MYTVAAVCWAAIITTLRKVGQEGLGHQPMAESQIWPLETLPMVTLRLANNEFYGERGQMPT